MHEPLPLNNRPINRLAKEKLKEFSEAIKRGKAEADAHVANRLYCRAMGYEHQVAVSQGSDVEDAGCD